MNEIYRSMARCGEVRMANTEAFRETSKGVDPKSHRLLKLRQREIDRSRWPMQIDSLSPLRRPR